VSVSWWIGSVTLNRAGPGAVFLSLLLALASGASEAQEPPGDETEAPAGERRREPARFPDLLRFPEEQFSGSLQEWGRQDLLDSQALSLLDFLSEKAFGPAPLRAGFYAGPHHLLEGPLGPGFVEVVLDGRPLPPFEGGQADLARIELSQVDRVRVVRHAGRTRVQVQTIKHEGEEAYSRVEGGTGNPGADLIRGLFVNGLGRNFTVGVGVEHVNVSGEPMPADRLDTWAKLSWMSPTNSTGVEVFWRADGIDRTADEPEEQFDRDDLFLHARTELAEGIQADAWLGRTGREPDDSNADTVGLGGDVDMAQARISVTAVRDPLFGTLEIETLGADGLPDLEARSRVGYRLLPGLTLEGEAAVGAWEDFTTSRFRGGISWAPDLGVDLRVRAGGATGTRGIARPVPDIEEEAGAGEGAGGAGEGDPADGGGPGSDGGDSSATPALAADSTSFDALSGEISLRAGPYRLSERITRSTIDRQIPFGASFDRALAVGPRAEVEGFETRVSGPLLPVGPWFERTFRVVGFWRHHETSASDGDVRYVPTDLAMGGITARDDFFQGDLEIRLNLGLFYRGEMGSAHPGQPEPVVLPSETRIDGGVTITVDDHFRLWWKGGNARGVRQQDFADVVFPVNRSVFGIKWEFFN